MLTIVSEDSPHCGQCGRVARIFWRERAAWVLVRLRCGLIVSLPWGWTNLPEPRRPEEEEVFEDRLVTLLSPLALQDLIRCIRQWRQPAGGRDENVIKQLQQ